MANRLSGMAPASNFPPMPKATPRTCKYDQGGGYTAFLAMNVVLGEEEILTRLEETGLLTFSQRTDNILILCDSGGNTHMTPWLGNLTVLRTVTLV